MNAESWSDQENDAIVAVYFEMLRDDLAGRAHTQGDDQQDPSAVTWATQGLDRVQELQHLGCPGRLWAPVYPRLSASLQFPDVSGGSRFEMGREEPVV